MDGRNPHHFLDNVPHPFALTLFADQVFWTEWNFKRIEKANRVKKTGNLTSLIRQTEHMPYDIHVVHPLRQPSRRKLQSGEFLST